MKLAIPALAAALFVSACAEWTPQQKQALVAAALTQIDVLNAQGIDPINASPETQAIIASGCAVGGIAYPGYAQDLADACAVIGKVAQ